MKLISTLALLAFTLSFQAVWADSDEPLPNLKLNNRASADAQKMLEKISDAKRADKDLLILSTAAWCPPCGKVHKVFDTDQAGLAKLKKTTNVIALENENLEVGIGDFLPTLQAFYPMVFFYNTHKNTWRAIPIIEQMPTDVDFFAKVIEETRSTGDHVSGLMKQFNDDVAKGLVFKTPDDDKAYDPTIALQRMFHFIPLDRSPQEAKALLTELEEKFRKNKQQFPFITNEEESARYYLKYSLQALLNTGAVTFEEMTKIDPEFTASIVESPLVALKYQAKAELMGITRLQGNLEAAKVCEAKIKDRLSKFPAGADKLKTALYYAEGFCHILKNQAGLESDAPSRAWLARAETEMTKEEFTAEKGNLVKYAATIHEYDFAVKYIAEVAAVDRAEFEAWLAEAKTSLINAEKAADAEKVATLKKQIEEQTYRNGRVMNNYAERKAAWEKKRKPDAISDL